MGDGLGNNVLIAGDFNLSLGSNGLASSVHAGVGIGRLEFNSVGLGVGEGVLLPSSSASVGLGIAVNHLLLGKRQESSVFDEVGTLHGSDG